jgi:hypothetical protein
MTAIHWTDAIDGSFTNPADWSGGVVPGSTDDAILDASGGAFTVSVQSSATVESLQLAANARLDISGAVFTTADGTGSGANYGHIVVKQAGALAIAGTFDNTGAISLQSSRTAATTLLLDSSATLTGGGTVTLTGNKFVDIEAGSGAGTVTLTNVDNTLRGEGGFGGDGLNLTNLAGGVIDADVAKAFFEFGGNGGRVDRYAWGRRRSPDDVGRAKACACLI